MFVPCPSALLCLYPTQSKCHFPAAPRPAEATTVLWSLYGKGVLPHSLTQPSSKQVRCPLRFSFYPETPPRHHCQQSKRKNYHKKGSTLPLAHRPCKTYPSPPPPSFFILFLATVPYIVLGPELSSSDFLASFCSSPAPLFFFFGSTRD
jgi:hypothetical protein